jgi:hypothetical protein
MSWRRHIVGGWCRSSSRGRRGKPLLTWTRWHSHRRWWSSWTWWSGTGASMRCPTRVVHKLHEVLVAVRATLERGTVFDEKPEEPCFCMPIAFSNNLNLGTNNVRVGFIFSEGFYNGPYPRRKIVSARLEFDLCTKISLMRICTTAKESKHKT